MKAVASSLPRDAHPFVEDDLSYYRNAGAMAQQREHLETLCQEKRKHSGRWWSFLTSADTATSSTSITSSIEEAFAMFLDPPGKSSMVEAATQPQIQPCDRVFWDLGANIGDSIILYTEALFHDLSCDTDEIRFLNLKSGRFTDTSKSSREDKTWRGMLLRHHSLRRSAWVSLGDWIAHRMKEASSRRHPEDYCYFGLEVRTWMKEQLHLILQNIALTVFEYSRSLFRSGKPHVDRSTAQTGGPNHADRSASRAQYLISDRDCHH